MQLCTSAFYIPTVPADMALPTAFTMQGGWKTGLGAEAGTGIFMCCKSGASDTAFLSVVLADWGSDLGVMRTLTTVASDCDILVKKRAQAGEQNTQRINTTNKLTEYVFGRRFMFNNDKSTMHGGCWPNRQITLACALCHWFVCSTDLMRELAPVDCCVYAESLLKFYAWCNFESTPTTSNASLRQDPNEAYFDGHGRGSWFTNPELLRQLHDLQRTGPGHGGALRCQLPLMHLLLG